MREFTVRPKIQDFELNLIEKVFEKPISENVRSFLKKYSGVGIYECFYLDKKGKSWEISQFHLFNDLYQLSKEFIEKGWGLFLPFAFDPGGWHFCLNMDEKDYGAIFINRWTDHLPEDQFVKIADSFEEFIDGLKREDEI